MAFFRRGLVALQSILLCGLALLLAMQSVAHAASAPAVTNVRIGTFEGFTRVVLQTNAPLNPRLFTLDGPDRLVIDLPEIEWRINAPKGKIDSRLIKSFRFGLFEPGVSRLVLALNGPARVDRFDQRVLDGGRSFEFDVRLDELGVDAVPLDTLPPGAEARFASTADQARRLPQAPLVDRETREQFGSAAFDRERADFGALGNLLDALGGKKPAEEERAAIETPSPGAEKPDTPAEPQLLASLGGAGIAIKPAEPPKHVGKPIRIMLDPGHGGYDPGTAPAGIGVTEKEINLLFSLELKKLLDGDPAFEVFMTRPDDTFVSLPDRVSKAQNQHADLLISIHADWFHDPAIKGATAYTLSEEASIRTTDRIVSDRGVDRTVAGIHLNEEREDVVRVLLDLARRETQTRSRSFGELVVEELEEVTPVVRGVRNHDLHVLRTADLPAVLIELGFVSNEEDRTLLQSPEWRKKTANAVKNALDRWRIERGMREFAHR